MSSLLYRCAYVLSLALLPFSLPAQEAPVQLELELGATYQERNRVQIPNDASGDRFRLTDIAGNGPWASARLNLNWNFNGAHGFRLVLAPLEYEESGTIASNIRFADGSFDAAMPVKATYKFNSWRASYTYLFHEGERWRFWVGATAKVRDAKIKLSQSGVSATDDDLGFVPLLYLAGDYQFNPRWSFRFDFDGLAGGPGRAFDISLKLGYQLNDQWRISAGYRGLEGGVDNNDVYNFAWFNTALLSLGYRF